MYTSPLKFSVSKEDSVFSEKRDGKAVLREKTVHFIFLISGALAIIFILLIFAFILKEAIHAFRNIGFLDFIYSIKPSLDSTKQIFYEWYPTSDFARYSLVPLLVGTFLIAIPATIIATVVGIASGIYLSEIAGRRSREFLKPVIELFSAIPTVVLGFFVLIILAGSLNDLFDPVNRLNAFVAAAGLSLIIIPIVASLTEDALRSVPQSLRMASYGLGATKWQTIKKVLLPAAVNGISASILIAFGRAVGETMIVWMASGNAENITLNMFRSVRTMTATIAAEMGQVIPESNHYYALFVVGLILFLISYLLSVTAEIILQKFRKKGGRA